MVKSLDEHPLPRLVAAGAQCSINTDDPAMFETNLGHGYTTLFDSIGWGADMARKFSLNSVDGSWLDESDKSALRMAGVTAAAYAVTMHWFAFLMGRKFAL